VLSGSSARKRAAAVCSWRLSAYDSVLIASASRRTAGELARYFGVASSIMRHRDAGLPALNGPASLDRAIKQLVSDNAKILKVEDEALARFKSMPKKRRVTDAELERYVVRLAASAERAGTDVVFQEDLPQVCLPL
jgi:predicted RecB family endonuclease